ncbi:Bgt-5194 [Blumeria graminis f. sp. tritici]|uniref:Pentatricopeptide repeat protein n=3 Tax=Blumeria graminis f. sp. tritici TaxID=62690 RepID=A0A656KF03_BLUGR|nr:hypothetical protein BGT96224_5194 [Blumeria graminis f. sp. tritici 96224]VDB93089.1 Bgt-5194 [Blumeria graminis f. sp. tritici]
MPLRQELLKRLLFINWRSPRPPFLYGRSQPWPWARRIHHAVVSGQKRPPISESDHDSMKITAGNVNEADIVSRDYLAQLEHSSTLLRSSRRISTKQLDWLNSRWCQLVTWLNRVTDHKIPVSPTHERQTNPESQHPRILDEDFQIILQGLSDRTSCYGQGRDKLRWQFLWPEFMAKLIVYHLDRALEVLEAILETTSTASPIFFSAISDTLHCIIVHDFKLDHKKCPSDNAIRICRFILGLPPSMFQPLSNHSMFILLSHLPREYLVQLYTFISNTDKQELSSWTLMHFISRLAKLGEVDMAFEAMQKLMKSGCLINRQNVLSLCTSLLYESSLAAGTNCNTSMIFQYMLKSGVRPNIFIYNVLLYSTIKSIEPKKAWDVYYVMVDSGIQPDTVTYSILLNDAKKRMDSVAMQRIMNIIRESGQTSEYIVTDVLHTILLLHQRMMSKKRPELESAHSRHVVFDKMLEVYVEHYELEPLTHIIPGLSEVYPLPNRLRTSNPPWIPTSAVLSVMLTGFLSVVSAHGAKIFYENFRELVRNGDPAVASLVKNTYVYNNILMCYYKYEERAKDAPDVIADMISPTRNDVGVASVGNRAAHTPAKPDIFTWSILVKIFMRLQLTRAAERVLIMMQRRDIQPDNITWTSLISGYSRIQNAKMTGDAVRRLKLAGYTPDDFVYRSIARVYQQDRLFRAMAPGESMTVAPPTSTWIENLKKDIAQGLSARKIETECEQGVEDEAQGKSEAGRTG